MKGIKVKDSSIAGQGLFATRTFKSGETITHWKPDKVITASQIDSLTANEQTRLEPRAQDTYYVMGAPECFINHSCEPNTFTNNDCDVAIRDIAIGEELTSDYSLNSMDDWAFSCTCGSKKCRKTITGDFRKLPDAIQKEKYHFLESWFVKELQNYLHGKTKN